jgi:t-SNARE complex subunit (syntaxin)
MSYGGSGSNNNSYRPGGNERYQAQDGDSTFLRMSENIQKNTFNVQRIVQSVEKMVATIGTPKETPRTQQQIQQALEEAKDLIKQSTSMLKQLSQLDGGSASEKRKRELEQKKLRDDLDQVANHFKDVYKAAIKKEQDTITRERAESVRGASGGGRYNSRNEEKQSLLDDEYDQRRIMQQDVAHNTALIEEREQGMRELESQMTEINEIFKDIATMVNDQGHALDSIEQNLTYTRDHVEEGTTQLTHASRYQKSARNKAFCLLIIVVIVAAILAIVLATTLNRHK